MIYFKIKNRSEQFILAYAVSYFPPFIKEEMEVKVSGSERLD
jgi:hypothetical protein